MSIKRIVWMMVGTASTLALGAALAIATFGAPHSAGAALATLYVGANAGANSGCASPGYTSIQSAVNAATSGGTVYLCASGSPYAEAVDISTSLTLTGDPGATIAPPAVWPTQALPSEFAANSLEAPQALIFIWGSQTYATVKGLTITGPFNTPHCGAELYGVLALDGATATISGNSIANISHTVSSNLLGCQDGQGILVGAYAWYQVNGAGAIVGSAVINDAAHATISGNTVSGYQKNGITVKGSGTTATITGNRVNGSNRDANYSVIIAQNGIEMAEGATGQIMGNTVVGNTYTGSSPFASASGVVIFGGCGYPLVVGAQVTGNTLINNDVGVYAVNYAADCYNPPSVSTNIKVVNNTISNDAVTNASPFAIGSVNYTAYQAGINEAGVNDKLINNTITGAGYAPQLAANGPFVLPIDTISGPTTAPKVKANTLG